MVSVMSVLESVVIVGFGGVFPGGPDVASFWRNVSTGVDAGRTVPAGRWTLSPDKACQPGPVVPDKTYSTWGCYLDDHIAALRADDETAALDPVCRLALYAATEALRAVPSVGMNRARMGVILGHIVLPSEATSAMSREVLLRDFEKHLFQSAAHQSPPSATAGPPATPWHPRNRRIAALPAEIIAERFQLGGTAFTLDAACASSLYALKLAVDELQSGRADVMLAGGLSRPDCQYTQIGFAQLQALSKRGRSAPLSAEADGLVVGEGAGVFVLKRLSDAVAAGDKIEAVIAGIGLSNDRGANLLAPHSEGQLRAMRAAYAQAGWSPDEVDYIECHATGTPTGDAVELASLHQLWATLSARPGQCVLGAVKSNVGHLLTGAGGAGVMKLLGMLRANELWPIANLTEPAAALRDPGSPFRVLHQAESWPETNRPRRAAINAFGFGGINAHVLLEEYVPARRFADHRTASHSPPDDIVLVGMEATIGPWHDLSAIRERLFGVGWVEARRGPPVLEVGKVVGLEDSTHPTKSTKTGFAIDQIEIPLGEFRIPPVELPDLLPQQQLMLQVVARALDQAGVGRSLGDRTGVFLGVSLDPNTTNFHCRWAIAERAASYARQLGHDLDDAELGVWTHQLQEAFGPPLTPNRVMGNLAAITASRIAREFDIGGPSFTISADEDSGLRALETAVRALQRGEIDLAITGAVELECDARAQQADLAADSSQIANDGAIAFLLKRRRDAERDGNPILARIDIEQRLPLSGPTVSHAHPLGYALATSGLTHILHNALALTTGIEPHAPPAQIVLQDRKEGLRTLSVSTQRGDAQIVLTEAPSAHRSISALGIARRLFVIAGDSPAELNDELNELDFTSRAPITLNDVAHRWRVRSSGSGAKPQAIVLVVSSWDELRGAIDEARGALHENRALTSSRVVYQPEPLGLTGRVAFVFPGSGNAFPGMGRELLTTFPGVIAGQQAENAELHGQYRPDIFWEQSTAEVIRRDHKAMIFGQVSLGTAMCDLLAAFGVRPSASLGYSLGESAALFGLRIWRQRDEMLERMRQSALFGSDLVAPFDAARRAWQIPAEQPVPWVSGVVNGPVETVREVVSRKSKCYVLLINTPRQCVIGGDAAQIEDVLRQLQLSFTPLGSPSTVHCAILNEVRRDYLELHRRETFPAQGIDIYSSATGEPYGISRDATAGAILAQATDTVDFTQVVRHAYRDGVRLFVEIGPGNSCSRMIADIIADQPHVAIAACPATSDPVGQFLSVLAQLIAHGVPVDLSPLFSDTELARLQDTRERIVTRVGPAVFGEIPVPVLGSGVKVRGNEGVMATKSDANVGVMDVTEMEVIDTRFSGPLAPAAGERVRERGESSFGAESRSVVFADDTAVVAFAGMLTERAEAHAAFLQFAERSQELAARLANGGGAAAVAHSTRVIDWPPLLNPLPRGGGEGTGHVSDAADFLSHTHPHTSAEPPRSLDYTQCLEFAIGKIGNVLGPKFAAIDSFPSRVRLPDEPLMLCHRILEIEGEPLSMTQGRVVTEHDIVPDAWYLDCGRIPTCIAVEAGQADLFLSGWLGADFETRGQAVYRLLDAVVTFHDGLPGPGATIHYDIRINSFFRQGETWLFRFEFDATVNGRKLLTMRDGCAGFFSAAELAGGKGIVHTALDKQPRPGIRPDDWSDPVPLTSETFSDDQLTALRRGDLAACFGSAFEGVPLRNPVTIPDGRMRLVDRVLQLDPAGGKYGIGLIRAEADIHPDDWFLTCHFCDDQVMPGTLMYECCLHTLRIYLLRMGWIGEAGDIAYEPIPEVRSRLKCRGQVLASSKKVWYEVTIKEMGYGRPGVATPGLHAYCIADALMYADGKPVVEMTDMSVRLTGLTREKVDALWGAALPSGGRQPPDCGVRSSGEHNQGADAPRSGGKPLFDTARITAFAIGKPSDAFGDRYRIFDEERKIARLPGPPFQFLDRIVSIENCEAWKLAAGGVIVAEYDVPADAWYFAANRQATMPFAVLLETALQPCGWLAGYLGSALTSETDLSFRNLGGKATQFRAVTAESGTLATTVKMTAVSQSGGMIIQHYQFDLKCRGESVYRGTTYFGFFSKESLENQIGIRDAAVYRPTEQELAAAESFTVPHEPPFPSDRFRMVDKVTAYLPQGGPQGLGYLQGTIEVDPAFWFFQAHFYQDPVWPGSLGLESFLQLLKVYAARRWGADDPRSASEGGAEFQTLALDAPHEWVYRGQVIPRDQTVTVDMVITAVDDTRRRATASGFLSVDGRVIYQMLDFSIDVS